MIKLFKVSIVLSVVLCSCQPKRNGSCPPAATYPGFINKDTANLMISSYVSSLGYPNIDTDLRSVVFDVKELRYYLDSLPNSSSIEKLEIKLAHKVSYINDGHSGQPAGLSSNVLTFILVGLDGSGNYVLQGGVNVINRGLPCPTNCPSVNKPL